ncbi:hypothetical protein CEN49_25940, partial [Fischerella thermalis CCMEE 5273]
GASPWESRTLPGGFVFYHKGGVTMMRQPEGNPSKNGYASLSLIMGVAGMIFLLLFPLISIMLGVAAMIVGRKGQRSCRPLQARTGFVLGIISIVMALFIFLGAMIALTLRW